MSQLSTRELAEATRQLMTLVRLGYPLADGLRAVGDASPWLGALADQLDRGDSLSQAVSRYPRLFSPFFRDMVAAAEGAGNLPETLGILHTYLEREQRLRADLRTILTYPLLVAVGVLALLALLGFGIVPGVLTEMAVSLGRPASLTPAIAALAVFGGLTVFMIVAMLGTGLGYLTPWTRSSFLMADQARWARGVAGLLAAGLPLEEALERALSLMPGSPLVGPLREAAKAVGRGSSLAQALESLPLEPGLKLAAVGGDGEDLAASLFDGAERLEATLDAVAAIRLKLLGPVAILLISLLTLGACATFWATFYDLVMRYS